MIFRRFAGGLVLSTLVGGIRIAAAPQPDTRPSTPPGAALVPRPAATLATPVVPTAVAPAPAAPVPVASATTAASADDTAFLRVFLKDGSTLISYGELARLDDRAVFSMPTSASAVQPQLQLVTLPSDRIDWDRTGRYADSARASRYIATRAEQDYALLSDDVAQALSDITTVQDPAGRLAIVERARKKLAEWPPKHYNYKQNDVRQMLGMLDEAIAELRAAAGLRRFDLSFVATVEPLDYREPLMPAPTPREAIEQTLRAASLTPSSMERMSLLTTVLGSLERDGSELDNSWAWTTRAAVRSMIDSEIAVDRMYQNLTRRYVAYAEQRAKTGDVRAIQNVLTQIPADDKQLGSRRPEALAALVGAVQEQLDAAQRMRLARDRWLLKSDEYKRYNTAVSPHLQKLQALKPALEDIKSLAGSTPVALQQVQLTASQILASVTTILPPEDLRSAHALLVSAAQLADSAARIRREAALSGDIARAWDASSAAAGALMLTARASTDIQTMLKPPPPIK